MQRASGNRYGNIFSQRDRYIVELSEDRKTRARVRARVSTPVHERAWPSTVDDEQTAYQGQTCSHKGSTPVLIEAWLNGTTQSLSASQVLGGM